MTLNAFVRTVNDHRGVQQTSDYTPREARYRSKVEYLDIAERLQQYGVIVTVRRVAALSTGKECPRAVRRVTRWFERKPERFGGISVMNVSTHERYMFMQRVRWACLINRERFGYQLRVAELAHTMRLDRVGLHGRINRIPGFREELQTIVERR